GHVVYSPRTFVSRLRSEPARERGSELWWQQRMMDVMGDTRSQRTLTNRTSGMGRPQLAIRSLKGIRVTRLWIAFVLGWLLVPVVRAGFLVASGAPAPRLVLEVLAVLAIAALYLWLTLRDSLRPSDLDPEGPAAPQLRRRLMLLSAMSVLVIALAALDPG